MKKLASLLVAISLSAASAPTNAGLIDSFEGGDVEGWVGINGSTLVATDAVPAAATEGTYALEVSGFPSGWRETAKSDPGILADLVNHDTVDIDLYVPSIPSWAQAQLVINNPTGGFQQFGFQNLVVGMNHLQATYDPSTLGTPGVGTNVWAILEIVINSDTSNGGANVLPAYYLDNFVLSNAVPEPSTIALFGLGAVVLAGVRLRK